MINLMRKLVCWQKDLWKCLDMKRYPVDVRLTEMDRGHIFSNPPYQKSEVAPSFIL